jgi:prephenate dehydrogenase
MVVVGIVGLGLMGGSFALALKEHKLADIIVGSDHNEEHIKTALDKNIIDSSVTIAELYNIADIIIYAIPVSAIIKALKVLPDLKPNALIIDLGGTKNTIIRAIPRNKRHHLVASHPMAGTEYSGPNAAFSTLYENKVVVICDEADSGSIQLNLARSIFEAMKMKIVSMRASEHDRHAAFISHMPHVISYALANSVINQEDTESILTLAAGGFRDMSRLAKSSPAMWKDIFEQNNATVIAALENFEDELAIAKRNFSRKNWNGLEQWMKNANKLHQVFTPNSDDNFPKE